MVRAIQKLFVSNLPWTGKKIQIFNAKISGLKLVKFSVGTVQLKKYITAEFGRVFSVNVVFDKKTGLSQKYGFVTVPKETLVNIEKKDRHRLEGNNIYFQSSE